MVLKDANYKSHWNILIFCDQWKMMSDSNLCHGKMFDFVSFPFCGFNLVIKVKNFDFKSRWSTFTFFDKKDMMSDLNMSYGKFSDFVSFPLFGFTLVIILRSFDFESHWNTLIFFDKKSDNRFKCFQSNSVLFGLSFIVWAEFWQADEKFEF